MTPAVTAKMAKAKFSQRWWATKTAEHPEIPIRFDENACKWYCNVCRHVGNNITNVLNHIEKIHGRTRYHDTTRQLFREHVAREHPNV